MSNMYITIADIDVEYIRNGNQIIHSDSYGNDIILRPEHDEKYNIQKQLILSYSDTIEDTNEKIKFLENNML